MSAFIHDPGNDEVIETLYAYLSVDEKGDTGIVASILPGLGSTPLVSGNRNTAKSMQSIAEQVAKSTGKKVALFAFDLRAGKPLWESA
jgi:hypothetical protein